MTPAARLARLEAMFPPPEPPSEWDELPDDARSVFASAYIALGCHEGDVLLVERGLRDFSGRQWTDGEQEEVRARADAAFSPVWAAYRASGVEAGMAEARRILDERRDDDGPSD